MDLVILALGAVAVMAAVGIGGLLVLTFALGRLDDPAHEAEADAAGLDLDGNPQVVGGRLVRRTITAELPVENPNLCVARQLGGCPDLTCDGPES